MKLLNEKYQIYSGNISELTFGFVRNLKNFSDEQTLNNIACWYDEERDRFVINEDSKDKDLYKFCLACFEQPIEHVVCKIKNFKWIGSKETALIIVRIRRERENREFIRSKNENINPNTKFVNIGDDVFQISKLVSVRRRDEADKSFIEVFVTNKQASIKKQFSNKEIRDYEFNKVKNVLELSA